MVVCSDPLLLLQMISVRPTNVFAKIAAYFALTVCHHALVLVMNLLLWTLRGFCDFCKLTQDL
jgi:hypothetical protein